MSQQVAEVNVKQMVHEASTGTLYSEQGCIGETKEWDPFDWFSITYLPCDPALTFDKKHNVTYDLVYLSTAFAHRVAGAAKVMQSGVVVVENAKWVTEMSLEQVKAYEDKVKEMAKGCKLQKADACEQGLSDFLVFTK